MERPLRRRDPAKGKQMKLPTITGQEGGSNERTETKLFQSSEQREEKIKRGSNAAILPNKDTAQVRVLDYVAHSVPFVRTKLLPITRERIVIASWLSPAITCTPMRCLK